MKIIYKNKSPSAKAKGLELASSPDCSIDRTFIYQFCFKTAVKKSYDTKKTYRNPIYLAKEYRQMINSGELKNQAELAKIKGILRARATQILNLLKLDKNMIDSLEQIGDPMDSKIISEREFRKIIHQN